MIICNCSVFFPLSLLKCHHFGIVFLYCNWVVYVLYFYLYQHLQLWIFDPKWGIWNFSTSNASHKRNDRKSNRQTTVHVPLENPGYCIIIYHILCTKIWKLDYTCTYIYLFEYTLQNICFKYEFCTMPIIIIHNICTFYIASYNGKNI